MLVIEGRVWRFPANVTTDDILPGQYLDRANHEVGQFAMAGLDSEFVTKIKSGDMIVAGANFGSGSGRETAPIALQLAGISAVIAPSFSRTYFRNSINIGLPPIIIENVDDIEQGSTIKVDFKERHVSNNKKKYPIQNLSGISLEILQAGGIVPYTKERIVQGQLA